MAKILTYIASMVMTIALTNTFAYGKVLRIPLHAAKISLDPTSIQDLSSLFVSRQVNCQLIRSYGSVISLEAAESIHWVKPTKISIKIKKDASFHDGASITSADVVASLMYLKHTRHTLRNMFNWIKDIEVINSKEFNINLKVPVPQFLSILSSPNYAIFKKEFLERAVKSPSLWRNPLGCGKYKIIESNEDSIKLTPIQRGYPIQFILKKDDELDAADNNYDIIDLHLKDDVKVNSKFKSIEIFDPTQIYLGLNTQNEHWKNKSDRCGFLAKLDTTGVIKKYKEQARAADDILPEGVLGYQSSANFQYALRQEYRSKMIPKVNQFCLSYLTVSIPKQYRLEYKKMIENIYPSITTNNITDNRFFGKDFVKSQCDALVVGIKSNTLDGYDMLALFSMPAPNFTGYLDAKMSKEIEQSQNVANSKKRYYIYRNLVEKIENNCLLLPIVTLPMKLVYIRNELKTPGIGRGALNEYDLSEVQ